ncbi:MAG: hypothetical protein JOZ39_04890 [Chloroflexi bacterium]|nr:hypothetical protein [Chloroflexota bacterium]
MAVSALARKLQIKPGMRIMIVNAPDGFFQHLEPLPQGAALVPSGGDLDAVQVFVNDSAELKDHAARAIQAVKHDGLLWIAYPKGGQKAQTDLSRDSLHHKMEADYSQVGCSLISIDDRWSAMRFRPADRH